MSGERLMQIDLSEGGWAMDAHPEVVRQITDFLRLQQMYMAGIKEVRTKLEILDDEFHVRFDHNPIHHIEYRLKSPGSIADKLRRKELPLSADNIRLHVQDVAGIRVICNYIDDIYALAELLTAQSDITLLCEKDYIRHPKETGYRSLHLVVRVPVFLSERTEQVPVEIQIRTIAMDFWASLEHRMKYKNKSEVSEELRARLTECAEECWTLDQKMQAIYHAVNHKGSLM